MLKRVIVVAVALAGLGLAWSIQSQDKRPLREGLAEVVKEVEALDMLRSSLAGSFAGEPDQETFAQVCMPVGRQAKRLTEEKGWKVRQLAFKNRNPANRLDQVAARVYRKMLEDPDLMGLWVRSEIDGQSGARYFRRIVVETSCLACHGAKDGRPRFVVEGYPEDRAYDFEVGDLRGLYSVFLSD